MTEFHIVSTVVATFDTVDPATGEVLATLPLAGEHEVDAAVAAARDAQPAWAGVDPSERSRILYRLADEAPGDHESRRAGRLHIHAA